MLETLDYTIRIGSILTFLHFDLYLYSAYTAHFIYFTFGSFTFGSFTTATLCLISRSFVSLHHEMVSHLFPFLMSISKLALRLFDLIFSIFFYLITSIHSFRFCPASVDKSIDFSPSHSIVYVHPPPTSHSRLRLVY